jgi:hypothetical protein
MEQLRQLPLPPEGLRLGAVAVRKRGMSPPGGGGSKRVFATQFKHMWKCDCEKKVLSEIYVFRNMKIPNSCAALSDCEIPSLIHLIVLDNIIRHQKSHEANLISILTNEPRQIFDAFVTQCLREGHTEFRQAIPKKQLTKLLRWMNCKDMNKIITNGAGKTIRLQADTETPQFSGPSSRFLETVFSSLESSITDMAAAEDTINHIGIAQSCSLYFTS